MRTAVSPRSRRLLPFLGLACSLSAAADAEAPRAGALEPVSIDLAEELPFASAWHELAAIPLAGPAAGELLTSGWHALERDAAGRPFRWTGRRDAVVEVPIVRPADFRLRLSLEPVHAVLEGEKRAYVEGHPEYQNQVVEVAWNGERLTTQRLAIGGDPVSVSVPASLQRVGPNRLELLPSFWLSPRMQGMGDDDRVLGVRCHGIALERAEPPSQPGGDAAVRVDGVVRQRPGTVVTHHLVLPQGARLVGDLAIAAGTEALQSPAHGGRVVVVARAASGASRTLVDEDLAPASSRTLARDLSELAAQPIALSVAYAAPPGSPPLLWRGLRVEGVRRVPAASAGEAIPRDRYPVLVVLFDSLRSDHVTPYGDERADTPALSALAERGVVFEDARANASWTRPSVASLLTGLPPLAHGVTHDDDALSGEPALLPEILRGAGYRTVAVTNNAQISASYGFGRGFDAVHELYGTPDSRDLAAAGGPEEAARRVWERYLAPTLAADGDRPFFAYVHERDPHSPYRPPPPFDARYEFGYRGRIDVTLGVLGLARRDPLSLDPMDVAWLDARYRGEVAAMDRYLGFLLARLAELEERSPDRHTLVVFLSDHGEEFWDHRSLGHGHTVFEELLRVPLVMALPGVLPAGLRPDAPVQLLDVAPTILDLVGIEPPASMRGRSLLPLLAGKETDAPARAAVAHSNRREHDALRLRIGRDDWKLVRRNPGDPERDVAAHSLFHLGRDPEERIDLWAAQPVVGAVLLQRLDAESARAAAASPGVTARGALSPSERRNLRELGYLE